MVKFFLLTISMLLTACVHHTPKRNMTKKNNNMVYLEKLDTADANKRILEYREKQEKEFPEDEFLSPPTDCEYIDSMGYVVSLGKSDSGYLKMRRGKDSLFGEYRYYFPNGSLKKSGEYYINDFQCGIWREYDMKGHLIKETDMDKPYRKYSWQNILLFAKKHNIDLHEDQTFVDRYIDETHIPYWYVSWIDKSKYSFRCITIDARNGHIVRDELSRGTK